MRICPLASSCGGSAINYTSGGRSRKISVPVYSFLTFQECCLVGPNESWLLTLLRHLTDQNPHASFLAAILCIGKGMSENPLYDAHGSKSSQDDM